MMVEQKGNTVDEAIDLALKKLGVTREKARIEIIAEGKKGVFGLGTQSAIVRVAVMEDEDRLVSVAEKSAPHTVTQEPTEETAKELILDDKSPAVEFLQVVLKGLGIEAKLQGPTAEDESQVVDIITSESALLIGKQGKNLEALQYLTNIAVNKGATGKIRILLDVEGYRKRRKDALVTLVKKITDEVRQTGKSVTLEPMSSYERRIVHLTLQEDPDITTESKGIGDERRVVIKVRKV